MGYADGARSLPPLLALLAGIIGAAAVPGMLILVFFELVGGLEADGSVADALRFLGISIGQAFAIAIPLGLYRWSHARRPLLNCLVIGAIAAPGPLGYLGLTVAVSEKPLAALAFWAILASLGALGGASFYLIATRIASRGRT